MSQGTIIAAPLTRRLLVKASLSVGFCAAISPVMAQVIATPADGLVVGEVKIPTSDAEIPAYRAMPDHGGPFPTVLVAHEIFGVHEHIKDICRRFARLGYYAICPELFARQGDASTEPDQSKVMSIALKKPDPEVISDLDATLAFAKASGSADVDRAAIGGFCWGGRQTWLYAAHNPLLKAAVAWYGPLGPATDPTLRPKNPPDIVAELKVPVLGLYGGLDKGITAPQVEAMQKKLAEAGGASKIIVYPDTGHAFFADYRPSYNKADAEESWKEATAWLKQHGV
jgi:carboxymethylenebutenolidase